RNDSKSKRKYHNKKPEPVKEPVPPQIAANTNAVAAIFEDHVDLHRDGSFHGAAIRKGVRYKHKNQEYVLSRGIFFYPSGNLKRFTVAEKTETNFIVDGKNLVLHEYETVYFHEESERPKTLMNKNWLDIDEDGNITGYFNEKSQIPDYD
ncbi:MAG: hypothetical protein FWC03_08900, partial [Treponema sp.]|nr:hypothetical protein [Treponema sp.]